MPEGNPYVNSTHDVFGLAVSLLDGFFSENVRSSYKKNIPGNTDKYLARLPEDIGLALSTMLKITRNQTIGNDNNMKTRFLNDMLDVWTALAHNYRGVDREGNNIAPLHGVLSPEQIEKYVGKEPREMPIIERLPPPRDFDERRWYDPRRLLGDSRVYYPTVEERLRARRQLDIINEFPDLPENIRAKKRLRQEGYKVDNEEIQAEEEELLVYHS